MEILGRERLGRLLCKMMLALCRLAALGLEFLRGLAVSKLKNILNALVEHPLEKESTALFQ